MFGLFLFIGYLFLGIWGGYKLGKSEMSVWLSILLIAGYWCIWAFFLQELL